MGFFKLGKKDDFIDLSERYKKQQERAEQMKEDLQPEDNTSTTEVSEAPTSSPFSIFGMSPKVESTDSTDVHPAEKKRKLAKRLIEMTTKLEEISNQLYHLQQRIEVVERKLDVGRF